MATMKIDLSEIYKDYIACLNEQGWSRLRQFIGDEVIYNGQRIGISGHRAMLERDFQEIPDLYFDIELLISESPDVACRLRFDCTPKREFLGLQVNGKKLSFTENVFYKFRRTRIAEVWSVLDKASIETSCFDEDVRHIDHLLELGGVDASVVSP